MILKKYYRIDILHNLRLVNKEMFWAKYYNNQTIMKDLSALKFSLLRDLASN